MAYASFQKSVVLPLVRERLSQLSREVEVSVQTFDRLYAIIRLIETSTGDTILLSDDEANELFPNTSS